MDKPLRKTLLAIKNTMDNAPVKKENGAGGARTENKDGLRISFVRDAFLDNFSPADETLLIVRQGDPQWHAP